MFVADEITSDTPSASTAPRNAHSPLGDASELHDPLGDEVGVLLGRLVDLIEELVKADEVRPSHSSVPVWSATAGGCSPRVDGSTTPPPGPCFCGQRVLCREKRPVSRLLRKRPTPRGSLLPLSPFPRRAPFLASSKPRLRLCYLCLDHTETVESDHRPTRRPRWCSAVAFVRGGALDEAANATSIRATCSNRSARADARTQHAARTTTRESRAGVPRDTTSRCGSYTNVARYTMSANSGIAPRRRIGEPRLPRDTIRLVNQSASVVHDRRPCR
jgi:hypothetical protein